MTRTIHPFAVAITVEVAIVYFLLGIIFFEFDLFSAKLFFASIPLISLLVGKSVNQFIMMEDKENVSN